MGGGGRGGQSGRLGGRVGRKNEARGAGKARRRRGPSGRAQRVALAGLAPLDDISVVPQQTGVLLMSTQQVQPDSNRQCRQSQQAWIISQHFWSPLVQVIVQPLSVVSYLHIPIVRLQ